MMENESLREPKNTTVMLLSLCLVVAGIVAIVGFAKASSRGKECDRLTAEKEAIRAEAEQIKQECQIKQDQAEKLRLTALEWTRQHQLQVQEEMRKKADEAAKQAKLKEAAAKKPEVAKTPAKGKGKAAPVKKSGVKSSTAKKTVHKVQS